MGLKPERQRLWKQRSLNRNGYARYRCFRCGDGVWHEGGHGLLRKHAAAAHPGEEPDGDVKLFERPAPAAVLWRGRD